MPLMKPEIQAVLRKAGLAPSARSASDESTQSSVSDLLEAAGLGLERTLENLADAANNSGNEALRIRANETALKLHGALKETAAAALPTFTIVIQDSYGKPPAENPIFLPRQLLTKLAEEGQKAS